MCLLGYAQLRKQMGKGGNFLNSGVLQNVRRTQPWLWGLGARPALPLRSFTAECAIYLCPLPQFPQIVKCVHNACHI